jgi:hypothetical protein
VNDGPQHEHAHIREHAYFGSRLSSEASTIRELRSDIRFHGLLLTVLTCVVVLLVAVLIRKEVLSGWSDLWSKVPDG